MLNALSKLRRLNLGHSVRESGYYSGRNRRSRSILMRLAEWLEGCFLFERTAPKILLRLNIFLLLFLRLMWYNIYK